MNRDQIAERQARDIAAGVPAGRADGCIGYDPGERCCEADGFGIGFITGTDLETPDGQ